MPTVPSTEVLALEPHGDGYALLAKVFGGLYWLYATREAVARALWRDEALR